MTTNPGDGEDSPAEADLPHEVSRTTETDIASEADVVTAALTSSAGATVRERVLHQLLGSLLYENAFHPGTVDLGALDTTSDAAADTAVGATAYDEPRRCEIRCPNGVRYTFRARRRATFGRVTVDQLLRDGQPPTSVSGFLADVAELVDADPDHLPRFARELEETWVKDTLAQHHRRRTETAPLAGLDADTLEGAVTDGHRYHPTYKSRIGFGVTDNLAYGPEFFPDVRPLWLSVDRNLAAVTTGFDVSERDLAPEPLTAEDDRVLVPVHPWQWRNHVAAAFAPEIAEGAITPLGADPARFRPQQSIRTLAGADAPHRPCLKLAMSLVNTSTSRVLAPHTVHNAPLISDWLAGIARDDPFLRDELRPVLLREIAGTAVAPAVDDPLRRAGTYGTLACIWRESLRPHLDRGEAGVPFTGLTARDLDGTPLIDPWVSGGALTPWVRRLAEAVVVPVLHLLCRHGVALESHAQNMVLLHRDGVPTRVALRDFHDGVRFSRDRLAEPDRCPPLRATPEHHANRNSFVETDAPQLVADFVLDAFLFIGVGELAVFLDDAYGLAEPDFWSIVADVLRGYLDRFPDPRYDVFVRDVNVEKLTTRRLQPDTELRLHRVPNPLATAAIQDSAPDGPAAPDVA